MLTSTDIVVTSADDASGDRPQGADAPLALVIDDDPTLRFLAREALRKCGLRVEEARDGVEGVEAFRRLRPDIVLLDVMMPRMDGFEACAQLRSLACGANVPVLMMTWLDDDASIQCAYESGATDFITKPIIWSILGQRVRYMLRAAKTSADFIRSEARLANAQHLARLASWEWDALSGRVIWSERAHLLFGTADMPRGGTLEAFLGWVHADDRPLLRQSIRAGLSAGQPFGVDFRIVAKDGGIRHLYAQTQPAFDEAGQVIEMHGALQDITERKAHQSQIEYLATHDALTDLPNRNLLNDRAAQAINHAHRTELGLAVLFVDLDHFKYVNDGYGHPVGDALLKAVARQLEGLVREGDTVARLGGDEFVILLGDLKNASAEASATARRMLERLSHPIAAGEHQFTVTASIGVSLYPDDGVNLDSLLMNADAAMYRSKEIGRNCYEFYAPEMSRNAIERVTLEAALRQALQLGQFEIHYQPQISITSGHTIGMEALLRWHHPELGSVPPARFIPVAEETGLIVSIGEWVLKTACRQNKAWQEAGLPPLPISVNLSALQLRQPGFVKLVSQILHDTALDPRHLELELTESMVIGGNASMISRLQALKALGVGLSLDDFGTGYSSLGYLKNFPIDQLKIDRSFVCDLPHSKDAAAIARAIVSIGQSLGMQVIAEGVETEAQAAFLSDLGCEHAQGFLYSKAISVGQLHAWLEVRIDQPAPERPISEAA